MSFCPTYLRDAPARAPAQAARVRFDAKASRRTRALAQAARVHFDAKARRSLGRPAPVPWCRGLSLTPFEPEDRRMSPVPTPESGTWCTRAAACAWVELPEGATRFSALANSGSSTRAQGTPASTPRVPHPLKTQPRKDSVHVLQMEGRIKARFQFRP